MCTTYILYSRKLDKYYIGSTRMELEERVRRHSSNHKGFTGTSHDWEVVYSKQFGTYHEARSLEMEMKRWKSRKRIEELISIGH